jgi:flotillin
MLHADLFLVLQAGIPELGAAQVAIAGVALGAVVVLSFVSLFVSRYKRCPANKVLVISGKVGGGESARCISGGGAFVWPVIQEYAYLGLEPIQIDIPLKDALSFENIRVAVPSVFTVAIGTEAEVRQNAAIRLLNLSHEQIKRQAQDIIFGQLRQVIASMRIEEINRDRDAFLHRVQTSLEPELKKIGLVLINVNITDLKDDSGYIEAIGKKAAATAVQQARGDVAEQEKLGEVRVAEADRERLVQVANAVKLREIGTREADREKLVRIAELEKEQRVGEQMAAFAREAQIKATEREQAVRIAELDKEQRIGEQRAAFERDAMVKEAEREKRVSVAAAEAQAIAGESESMALVAVTRAQLQVREAEAYQLSETKRREAEAAVQEAQNRAMARAALAEAERVEAERRAEVEAPAKAEKAKTIVEAEAEAQRRRIEAEAEAAAIYMKLEAEARGQYEVMSKKADALKEIVLAAGGAKEAFQLLLVEHLDTLAETSAKAISNIKFDKVVVWDGGGTNGATSGFLQSMANTLPPMMHVLRDIAGVELPSYMGALATESRAAESRPAEAEVHPSTAIVADAVDKGVVAPSVTPLSPTAGPARTDRPR